MRIIKKTPLLSITTQFLKYLEADTANNAYVYSNFWVQIFSSYCTRSKRDMNTSNKINFFKNNIILLFGSISVLFNCLVNEENLSCVIFSGESHIYDK